MFGVLLREHRANGVQDVRVELDAGVLECGDALLEAGQDALDLGGESGGLRKLRDSVLDGGRRGLGGSAGGGVDGALRGRARQSEARRAGGPCAPTLAGEDTLGDGDLLFAAGLVGRGSVFLAAVGVPGARRELQAALVAVAGVDAPVAAGLALCEAVPVGVGSGSGGAAE